MEIDTLVKNSTFIMVLKETGWGKMSVMTVGSFQIFVKVMTLVGILYMKDNIFNNKLDFDFICFNGLLLFM